MPPKKGHGAGRNSTNGKGSYSSWNDGGLSDWGGYDDYYSYGSTSKGKGQWNRGARSSSAWPNGGNRESRGQFLDRLMWEDKPSKAWTEKEEGELRAKANVLTIPATPKPIQILAQAAVDSPMDDAFGALEGEMDEAMPDAPSEVCLYGRRLAESFLPLPTTTKS